MATSIAHLNSIATPRPASRINLLTIFLCVLFALTFMVDFGFIYIEGFPRLLKWVPEGLAVLVLVAAILSATSHSMIQIPGRYVIWLMLVALVFIIGVIVNQVESGAMFYGARVYLRYLPFLLLPVLVRFTERDSFIQLKFILLFAFIQLPFAVYQFMYLFGIRDATTGDVVRGTLTTSGHLTMFLMMGVIAWTALYVRKKIGPITYLLGAPIIVIPSWLNESTSTLFLLPLAVLLPVFFDRSSGGRILKIITSMVVLTVLMGGFVWTYSNNFTRWGGDLTNVFSEESGVISYVYRGADEKSRADGGRAHKEIGRLDSVLMPFKVLDDPIQWVVGVGIGNTSSTQNRHFKGEYSDDNERYGMNHTTYSAIIWETGVLGLLFSLWLMAMVYRDGMVLSRRSDGQGAIGFIAALLMVFMIVAFAYKNVVPTMQITGSLALLAGHVISMRGRHDEELRRNSGV